MCETSWPSFSVSARIAKHSGSVTKAFHFSFAIGKAFPFQDVIQIVVTVTNQGRPEADRAELEFVLPQLQRVVHETGIQVRQPAGEGVCVARKSFESPAWYQSDRMPEPDISKSNTLNLIVSNL